MVRRASRRPAPPCRHHGEGQLFIGWPPLIPWAVSWRRRPPQEGTGCTGGYVAGGGARSRHAGEAPRSKWREAPRAARWWTRVERPPTSHRSTPGDHTCTAYPTDRPSALPHRRHGDIMWPDVRGVPPRGIVGTPTNATHERVTCVIVRYPSGDARSGCGCGRWHASGWTPPRGTPSQTPPTTSADRVRDSTGPMAVHSTAVCTRPFPLQPPDKDPLSSSRMRVLPSVSVHGVGGGLGHRLTPIVSYSHTPAPWGGLAGRCVAQALSRLTIQLDGRWQPVLGNRRWELGCKQASTHDGSMGVSLAVYVFLTARRGVRR